MRILKYLALVFLATLLVADIPLVLLSQSVQQTLLEPDFYMDAVEKYEVYDLALDQLMDQFPIGGLTAEQIQEIVPEEWATEQLRFILTQHLAYVKGETQFLSCTVELGEVRDRATPLATQIMSQQYIAQLPPGSDLALSQAIIAQTSAQVDELVKGAIPESINVAHYSNTYAKAIRFYVEAFQEISTYLIYATIVLILLISLAAWAPPTILRWTGASLALGGAISYGVVTFGIEYASEMLMEQAGGLSIPPDLISGLLGDVFAPMLTYGKYLMLLGALLMVASFFVHLVPDFVSAAIAFVKEKTGGEAAPKAKKKEPAPKPEKKEAAKEAGPKPEEKEGTKSEKKEAPKPEEKEGTKPAEKPKAAKGKKCPKCGAQVGKKDEFCGECGADLK